MSGGFRKTTNNRMEIMAAIAGLEWLDQRCGVAIYTDSKYLENGITRGWAVKWRSNGWMDKGEVRLNWDLWSRLLVLCEQHSVQFHWVRGHAGNAENERCDSLAVKAAQQVGLPADEGYEAPMPPAVPCAPAKSTQLCFLGLD
jgi:ribonuclease HI